MKKLAAVILAAGKSKRMKSKTPKILHKLMGKTIIDNVLDAVNEAGINDIVMVVGHEKERVKEYLTDRVKFAEQNEQLGTGHAVMQAMPALADFKGDILIICGDMPLISPQTIKDFIEQHRENNVKLSLLTAIMDDAGRLGRIVRDGCGGVRGIVEAVDASAEQLKINEVNTGTYLFDADFLREILPHTGRANAQNEIYLTDTVVISSEMGERISAMPCPDWRQSLGINDRVDMSVALKVIRERINKLHMQNGVTICDPESAYIEYNVEIGNDTTILPGVMILGSTKIGSDCTIGPNTRIDNSIIADNVNISESVIVESEVGSSCNIGPFAHLRSGSKLSEKVKVGNFVETKKTTVGEGSKIPHLSYVGDATVGTGVNIGAGTITCNYDGKKKNPTVIKNGAFIGSNSSLVAPVIIGEGAATGAGSVVTKDIPDMHLAVGLPARAIKMLHK